jgi:hypothetical protein
MHAHMSASATLGALLLFVFLSASYSPAGAQGMSPSSEGLSRPQIGGTQGIEIPQEMPTFGASGGAEILRHRGPTGAPCLTVGGFARPYTINPNLYDHVVVAENSCAQQIDLQVCYYQTQDCIPMEVPGGERTEAILGIVPAEKDFRFEFREKF